VLIRNGESVELPSKMMTISGKDIYFSEIVLMENDMFIFFSDGVEHAGAGNIYSFGWKHEDIVEFIKEYCDVGFNSKTISSILIDECNRLYDNKPADDTTICTVRIRPRVSMNLLIGPPSNPEDCNKMMSLFFGKGGKHIVCGGTTSTIAADFLNKPLQASLTYDDLDIPPTAEIEGVDLVTEGVITINRVLEYARDCLDENLLYKQWTTKSDGASKIARLLFEEATDISFFVGRAVNPAHQNPALPINFNIKMRLVDELASCLKSMGKKLDVTYF
jgi:hypothetical protein